MRIVGVLVPATVGGASEVKKSTGSYPRVRVEGGSRSVVPQVGAVLLVDMIRNSALDTAIGGAGAVVQAARGA